MVVMSMYDSKAKMFVGGLRIARNVDCAIRDFSQMVVDENFNLKKFPDDYSLYLFGEFNENDGSFKLNEHPTKIITAKEVLANG